MVSNGCRIVLLLAVASIGPLTSQPASADSDIQLWTAAGSTAALDEKPAGFSLWLDAHLRRGDGGTVHIARPALGYRFGPTLSAWLGYAWVPNFVDGADTLNEHRIWQQGIFKRKISGKPFQARTRFEQRFGEGDDVGFRLRQFVRLGVPLESTPNLGLVVWDEIFIGLNETDWGAPSGFDQNRLFLGGYVSARKNLRVEVGYIMNYLNRTDDITAHVLATNFFISL